MADSRFSDQGKNTLYARKGIIISQIREDYKVP